MLQRHVRFPLHPPSAVIDVIHMAVNGIQRLAVTETLGAQSTGHCTEDAKQQHSSVAQGMQHVLMPEQDNALSADLA